MTKPRLVKVRALLYVLHHIKKRGCAYFDTAPLINKVKSKCCGIKGDNINGKIQQLET